MGSNPCFHCGLDEDEHCTFEPIPKRPGCVCDTMSWGAPDNVPPVCAVFLAMPPPEQTYCKNCEHDEGCHSPAAVERGR